jgi:hypothetical protein
MRNEKEPNNCLTMNTCIRTNVLMYLNMKLYQRINVLLYRALECLCMYVIG